MMTTITLSPGKHCFTSSPSHLKKRHTLPMLTNGNLPDLLNDIFIEQQQRQKTIVNIATLLRKVGDQMDEQLQINNNVISLDDCIFGQGTLIFITCVSHVLRFFL
ncbi:hypothetical protein I4U23_001036 [Adineta vaga]|nr:hypothetical protein I4U23_001036 [Adineta vaga]